MKGEGRPRRPACLLASVLAVQVLPGHFQLAFTTEVGVLVLALASARGAWIRAGMVAREQELTTLLEQRTGGGVPTLGQALQDPVGDPVVRAPRAGA